MRLKKVEQEVWNNLQKILENALYYDSGMKWAGAGWSSVKLEDKDEEYIYIEFSYGDYNDQCETTYHRQLAREYLKPELSTEEIINHIEE